MKKVFFVLLAAIGLLCINSCTKMSGSFSISPSSMTISVGETQFFKINVGSCDPEKGEVNTTIVEGEQYIHLGGTQVTGVAAGKAVVVAYYTPEGAEKASHTASITITVR